jgi:cytochrome c551/c552
LAGYLPTARPMPRKVAPASLAVIAKAAKADKLTPSQMAHLIRQKQKRGTPFKPVDAGENLRELGSAIARQPGAGRTLARTASRERQVGQPDRIKDALNRDLGPTTDVRLEAENLIRKAGEDAAPLYDIARAQPGFNSEIVDSVLQTPSGREALSKASRLAADEGVDLKALGVDFDDAGDVVMKQVPSPVVLDYIQRGLGDVVDNNIINPITGQMNAQGRAALMLKNKLVSEMDTINPAYKEARAAYAGPMQAKEAMEQGARFGIMSPSELAQYQRHLRPSDNEPFKLGVRSNIADTLGSRVDAADRTQRLIGGPDRRQALGQVFGNDAGIDSFNTTLLDEQAMQRTYNAINSGSQTAGRLADDAALGASPGQSNLDDVMTAATGGKSGILRLGLQKLQDHRQFGYGQAADKAREDAASLLFGSNPNELRLMLQVLRLQQQKRAARDSAVGHVGGLFGASLSQAQGE